MSDWSREGAIAMERRHIAGGRERIARQEALLKKLLPNGNQELILRASELLDDMREFLETAEARLRYLEADPNL
jgi:hypothetical protein